MSSPALAAYLAASRLAGPAAGPLLRRRLARGKEDAARLGERLGKAGRPRPEGRLVWVHGASVGEATSALPLVGALRARSGASVLVTSGTVTSARRMAAALPDGALHQFAPVDTDAAVRGFLDHWRPDLAVWIESELWPRLVVETARRGVPMALVNARLSERSFRRWRRLPGMARRLLGAFGAILAQDVATVERIRALGGEARFAGNLKALVEPPACDASELDAARAALAGRSVWLAASTHAGEEEAALAAHLRLRGGAHATNGGEGSPAAPPRARGAPVEASGEDQSSSAPLWLRGAAPVADVGDGLPAALLRTRGAPVEARRGEGPPAAPLRLRGAAPVADDGDGSTAAPLLILAPRHPERGDEVAGLVAGAGLRAARRSRGEAPGAEDDVWLADTLGEMGLWCRLAPVAFVGGSFAAVGGHTPFEPAQLGCAVLHGPHVANFAPAYAALDGAGGALSVADADALAAALEELLADPGRAEAVRARAREVHARLRPDLDAMADGLIVMMEGRA